ncbi:ubiquinol-cytochrome C chaperone family protein [Caulobacter sp. NIBR2454]|uniref:ubiquinol-cytochrome C chaperone family protein n=1 Tax=Caulobacter sp. NIBR2454 TaxID=3015996 RepID=UPI0022B636B0|nr:ubiquinol-cytochrome C chaperone family protein [Caulobacter sp. NIBR2454]
MFLERFFPPSPAKIAGRRLYDAAAQQARSPGFYTAMGVADSLEGRFELYSLHVALVVERLRGEGQTAADVSQATFDAYVRGLDDALREIGVGDLSVGKKMKKLAAAFYGRLKGLDDVFAALPDKAPLQALIERTVAPAKDGEALADYILKAREHLAAQHVDALLAGTVTWPEAA